MAYKKLKEIIKYLQTQLEAEYSVDDHTNYFRVSEGNYLKSAEYLKEQGFQRLLTVSAVDWIKKGTFEIYYIVHKLAENMYIKVASEVPREKPIIPSLCKLWPNAGMHERETWELFNISFDGNNDLKPLFLESVAKIPPFRKDFDWRKDQKAK